MNGLEKILAIGLCGAVVSIVLKKDSPQLSLFSSLLTCVMIFGAVISALSDILNFIKEIFLRTNLDSDIINTVFKICGIGITAEYFCNIIEDAGESAISRKMEFCAKILIFVSTLPIIANVIDSIWSIF